MMKRRRPEQAVHQAVVQHLDVRGKPGMFYFHPANGGFRTAVEGSILKSLGVRQGVPDLIILYEGRTYALELKASSGRLTVGQRIAHADMRTAGATVETATGIDEALRVLSGWGVMR